MCNLALVGGRVPAHIRQVRAAFLTIFGTLALALTACGGQTGEGSETVTQCVDGPARTLGDAEPSELGFSGADVLAVAAAAGELSLLRSGPDATPLTASLALRAVPGSVSFVPSALNRELSVPDPCRGSVQQDVELELRVTLPNGVEQRLSALGVLRADSRYRARLTADFSAADFGRVSDIQPEAGETVERMPLRAQLTPAGSSGELSAVLEHLVRIGPQPEPRNGAPRAHDYTTERIVSIARWPAEGCAGGLPLASDSSLFEIEPGEVLHLFATDVPIRWNDGSETLLRLRPMPMADTCMVDGGWGLIERYDYPPFEEQDPALFGQPIELALSTADGRFQNTVQTHLQYEADKDGGLRRAWLKHWVSLMPGEAGGWTGIESADLATPRSWELLVVHEPAARDLDRGQLMLRIRRETPPCKDMACLPPGIYVELISGELE